MPSFTRREFIKKATGIAAAGMVSPSSLFSSGNEIRQAELKDRLYNSPFPFNYDSDCFASSERIFFKNRNQAYLNLFVNPGKKLEVKLYVSETGTGIHQKMPLNLTGVEDSLDISVGPVYSPDLYYKVEYRDGRYWKSHESRHVKTPNVNLQSGEKIKIILIGDDHVYADLKFEPEEAEWRKDVLSGDYINRMMRGIIADANYIPELDIRSVIQGYTLAHTIKYILEIKPDLVLDLGDTVGPDSYGIWGGMGQWPELQPLNNLVDQSRILWERKRRTLSAITPEIPYYLTLGNHDGENGWFTLGKGGSTPFTQPYVKPQRKRLLEQPQLLRNFEKITLTHRSEAPLLKNPDQNYFPIIWTNGDIRFLILDVNSHLEEKTGEITDWTLGERQKTSVKYMLSDGNDVPWKFICFHNTVGGYPLGSGSKPGAYGRGPLFSWEDYERINEIDPSLNIDPADVEQVWLTDLAREFNVRGFFYGHDHIFFKKNIGKTSLGKDMLGVCVGSTKYTGSNLPANRWGNPYHMAYYGPYFEDPPPFLTPPGITELEIDEASATIRYVCTAPPECMHSNMPPGTKPGDILREYKLLK